MPADERAGDIPGMRSDIDDSEYGAFHQPAGLIPCWLFSLLRVFFYACCLSIHTCGDFF